ncbi:divisome protein SepX/GlpR [Corynebacterium freneyi]
MSSSLLLVLIVVVWLFVLAPLVVNTRQPIRRTSEALGRTRLLHQGGESVATRRRRPVLTERDVRAPGEEVDESLETVDAELDDPRDDLDDAILIDDTEDVDARGGRSRLGRRVRGGDDAGAGDGVAADEVPAVVDGDIVYELEAGADAGADVDADAETDSEADGEAGADGGAVVDDAADSSRDDADLAAEAPSTRAAAAKAIADAPAEDARAYLTPEDFLVIDGETSAEQSAAAAEAAADDADADDAEAAEAGADADSVAETDDDLVLTDDSDADAGSDADLDVDDADFAELDDTLTDDDLAFAERRRGRGGFDPVSDARYAETRFARRRRSVGVLAALIVLGVILGVVVGGWTWWLPLAGTGLMVLYLVYLRRTVIAEKELRARRIRRMKMARMGVRNSEDEELGIPERLRRPGAVVVELDDEDPDFADLPYVTHEFPEEDIRRAAGQ